MVGPAYPLRGGIAHFNESFAHQLKFDGHQVKIASFYLQYPSILFPGKTQLASGDPPRELDIHSTISSINPASWFKTAATILSWKPQFVVIRFWLPFMGPSLGYIAKRLRKEGILVIGLVDNAIPHESRFGDRWLSHLFFKNCDAFFTLSQSVAEDLAKLAPRIPAETSPHPVYDLFGDRVTQAEALDFLELDPSYSYILFFGFVRKYKGLDLLMKGFAHSELSKRKVKILVAGEFYEDESTYIKLAKDLNIENDIVFKNEYIPEEHVKYYFCVSSIIAQTYRTATQSGVTQIAYHFERPMLVTNVGGLAEIVPHEKAGFVTEVDEKAIGKCLARFFQEDLEKSMSAFVAKEKRRFSWEHFSRKFISFVHKIKPNQQDA